MKYLIKFETETEKNIWGASSEYVTPNVVLTGDVVDYNYDIPFQSPMYIEALEDLTIRFGNTYEYSKDNATWTDGTSGTSISANAGDKVYFRASGLTPSGSNGMGKFTILNGSCNVAGNVMSMVYGADFIGQTTIPNDYQFANLFLDQTNIINASALVLPAKCRNGCYYYMFNGCTSLVNAPVLPATTLASNCYTFMFAGCTSLVNAPELPVTTLASDCYKAMFNGCTSLVNAPALPATTLASKCYHYMFNGCTSLSYIKAMFTTTPSDSYTSNWLSGVASTGTFVKNSAATWDVTGVNGVPSGWTVETDDA